MIQDTYRQTKEVTYGNAIICVYVPELTKEERKHRETNVKTVLRIIGKELAEKGKT